MIREGKKLPEGIQNRIPEIIKAVEADSDVIALYAFGSLAMSYKGRNMKGRTPYQAFIDGIVKPETKANKMEEAA